MTDLKKQPGFRGFSLLEVLVAIVIFAIGMLALGALQGSLTRSASDANLRTVAANIAERTIEDLRTFRLIDTDPDGVLLAYNDIVSDDNPVTVTDGALVFQRLMTVTDYFYDKAADSFSTTAPTGIAVSDFKLVEVNVAWDSADFYRDSEQDDVTGAGLGTGEITLSAIVSSMSAQGGARVTTQTDETQFTPSVNYNPGANPDIVSLALGQNKFKESLTPQPDVIRASELVETRFDVITYSQSDAGSLFLRREEFLTVSCECTLYGAPDSDEDGGRRPTAWAGDEYLEPVFVAKPYGVSANNQQSAFCDTCCQDHHDGGSHEDDPDSDPASILYDPFRAAADYWTEGTFDGDHKHYKKDRRGNLSLATNEGDVYVEACRLVRKDGFFRVAQDFRQEGNNVFPYDYLDQTSEVGAYSTYVTDEVGTFVDALTDDYASSPPVLNPPQRTPFGQTAAGGDLTSAYTFLPTALGTDYQQLRSRGIYIDYLSEDLREVIDCLQGGGTATECSNLSGNRIKLDKTGSTNVLELVPFFDVQLTFLNRWNENPPARPVETSNQPLETNNTHSRGLANRTQSAGSSQVLASGHRGNLGLTDTDPIDLNFLANTSSAELQVIINTDNPPAPDGVVVTGVITSGVPGLQAAQVDIEATDATCERTPVGFSCLVPTGGSPTLKVSNYRKPNVNTIACSYEATLPSTSRSTDANNPFTIFSLQTALDTIEYQISIEQNSCAL
jgi:prepilin-type N-terminal cleavage/methylation domain-containing protein